MLLKNENIEMDDAQTHSFYEENDLIVCSFGCLISDADAMKLFYKLKDRIKTPTLIILCCNVTESYSTVTQMNILKMKEKYPAYKLFLTGCINEQFYDKFKKHGTVIKKEDMWSLDNYD